MLVETDTKISRGLTAQFERRAALIADGAHVVGWKAGLGSRAAMAEHGTTGPVPGFLNGRCQLDSGQVISGVAGAWLHAEPEMAVRVRGTISDVLSDEQILAAIGATAPAIEVIDPVVGASLEDALACDIFHHAFVLGEFTDVTNSGDVLDWRAEVSVDGRVTHSDVSPVDLSGTPVFVLRHLARALALVGASIGPGHIVILGSLVPAIDIAAVSLVEVRSSRGAAVLQVGNV